MGDFSDLLRRFGERLQTDANVRSIFGEPITTAGRTIVPVARIGYGFGVGGSVQQTSPEPNGEPGGGGGLGAYPVGALEITAEGTRFIPFADRRSLGVALAIGFLAGITIGHKLLRS